MTNKDFLLFLISGPLGALAVWAFFYVLFTFGG
jgi:hypothetical protein